MRVGADDSEYACDARRRPGDRLGSRDPLIRKRYPPRLLAKYMAGGTEALVLGGYIRIRMGVLPGYLVGSLPAVGSGVTTAREKRLRAQALPAILRCNFKIAGRKETMYRQRSLQNVRLEATRMFPLGERKHGVACQRSLIWPHSTKLWMGLLPVFPAACLVAGGGVHWRATRTL